MLSYSLVISILVVLCSGRKVPVIKLSSGYDMPIFGLGVGGMQPSETEEAVTSALKLDYTFFDAAYVYGNEVELGRALKTYFSNGGRREDVFISSKLPPFGYKAGDVEKFIKISLNKLGLDYLDLYIIHHSIPVEPDDETGLTIKVVDGKAVRGPPMELNRIWKEMEDQVKVGRTKSIGLSNFDRKQMQIIYDNAEIKPSNWQIEIHAYFQQKELREFAKSLNISVTAFSPLGSLANSAGKFQTPLIKHPVILKIAQSLGKTPAQVLLRHLVQNGLIVIPKTIHSKRMVENQDIFDFELSQKDMRAIEELDMGEDGRVWTFEAMYNDLVQKELNKNVTVPII